MNSKCVYPSTSLEEQIRGCLIGVAVGDALGAPFESLPLGLPHPALKKTGGRITDFHAWASFPKGSWTDDTGMTLATCRELIDHVRSKRPVVKCLIKSLKIWAGSYECCGVGHTVYHASKYGVPDGQPRSTYFSDRVSLLDPVLSLTYILKRDFYYRTYWRKMIMRKTTLGLLILSSMLTVALAVSVHVEGQTTTGRRFYKSSGRVVSNISSKVPRKGKNYIPDDLGLRGKRSRENVN